METVSKNQKINFKHFWRDIKDWMQAFPFLAPSLLFFTVFVFIPLVRSVILSMHATNPIGIMTTYVEFKYYKRLFASEAFMNSLVVTLKFVLYTVPPILIAGLVLSTLANLRLRGVSAFRIIFSLTISISGATAALLFMFLYHPLLGTFNYLLSFVGVEPIPWLIDTKWALIAVAIPRIWLGTGFSTVLLLAGMQGINEEYYEAAKIDGAGFWESWKHITLPLITPSLFFLLVVTTLGAFQTFTEVNVLTAGGPVNSTDVIVQEIFRSFYFNGQYGLASAEALVLFVIILALTIIQFGVLEKRVNYE